VLIHGSKVQGFQRVRHQFHEYGRLGVLVVHQTAVVSDYVGVDKRLEQLTLVVQPTQESLVFRADNFDCHLRGKFIQGGGARELFTSLLGLQILQANVLVISDSASFVGFARTVAGWTPRFLLIIFTFVHALINSTEGAFSKKFSSLHVRQLGLQFLIHLPEFFSLHRLRVVVVSKLVALEVIVFALLHRVVGLDVGLHKIDGRRLVAFTDNLGYVFVLDVRRIELNDGPSVVARSALHDI